MRTLFIALFSFFVFISLHAASSPVRIIPEKIFTAHDTLSVADSLQENTAAHSVIKENKKLVAAILAFPIPFGIFGLHRIYLGTDPWVPVAYALTLGGCGLVATIDFIEIVCSNEESLKKFEHNPDFFMWTK